MRTTMFFLLAVFFSGSAAVAQNRTANTLNIYVIDVEGGNAVLFVAPSGESMLVDTGNGGDGAVRGRSVCEACDRAGDLRRSSAAELFQTSLQNYVAWLREQREG